MRLWGRKLRLGWWILIGPGTLGLCNLGGEEEEDEGGATSPKVEKMEAGGGGGTTTLEE